MLSSETAVEKNRQETQKQLFELKNNIEGVSVRDNTKCVILYSI